MEKIEKGLADHHEFVKQTVAPTNLVIKPEHVDELLKRVMTSSTEMQSSLKEIVSRIEIVSKNKWITQKPYPHGNE
ncbi:hypothetical protein V3C99_015417 [Haemonchus contortus]